MQCLFLKYRGKRFFFDADVIINFMAGYGKNDVQAYGKLPELHNIFDDNGWVHLKVMEEASAHLSANKPRLSEYKKDRHWPKVYGYCQGEHETPDSHDLTHFAQRVVAIKSMGVKDNGEAHTIAAASYNDDIIITQDTGAKDAIMNIQGFDEIVVLDIYDLFGHAVGCGLWDMETANGIFLFICSSPYHKFNKRNNIRNAYDCYIQCGYGN